MQPVNQTELESLICFFQNTLLLEGLDHDMLSRLARSAQRRLCQPYEIICRRNDYAACFHFVEQGVVAEFSVDRRDFQGLVYFYEPGSWFSALDAMLGDCYTATAVAAERCSLITIPAELLRRAMETPGCRQAMLRVLRTRLRDPQDPALCHLSMNAEERLAYVLLLLQTGSLGMRYVRITQEDLAVTCGIARQTASRILGEWKGLQYIDTFRGKITIRNPHALAAVLIKSVQKGA
ncbi:MAG: Crp/Fnr family transcriptional regulator [Provencibacterium sp.]|nr:Crp/Fnr family transcriptional regulator [Provencibacterium sp.]